MISKQQTLNLRPFMALYDLIVTTGKKRWTIPTRVIGKELRSRKGNLTL